MRQEALDIASWLIPAPVIPHEMLTTLKLSGGRALDDVSEDSGTGNTFGGDGSILPDLGPLKSLGSWPSVGSTIVHKVEQLTGFNPASTDFNPTSWNAFLQKFSTMPFFLNFTSDSRVASISSLSLDQAVGAVDDLLKAFTTENTFNAVVTSIKKIAQLALENKGQTQKNNFQQQGVLSVKESQLYIGTIRTIVEMKYKSGKGYEQLTQEISVYRGFGVLDFSKCIRQHEILEGWDGQNVEEWEKGTASAPVPPNQSPAWNSGKAR
ncbi:hypothetical protein WMF18_39715 [Sorangium sp. So ce315]|uniref:hypothetical protein n=1 Tax=Sorangium sp. So ce315 TaxID=3133299 RepID=UPI003F5F3AE3